MKKTNDLSLVFPDYAKTPKAVIAAICYSLAERLSAFEDFNDATEVIRTEWAALHSNGIIPQKPIAKAEGGAK